MDKELPPWKKSTTDTFDSIRTRPRVDNVLPNRKYPRTLKELPNRAKSRMERVLPHRVVPKTVSELPNRVKLRRL
jgi:hypothetical protein